MSTFSSELQTFMEPLKQFETIQEFPRLPILFRNSQHFLGHFYKDLRIIWEFQQFVKPPGKVQKFLRYPMISPMIFKISCDILADSSIFQEIQDFIESLRKCHKILRILREFQQFVKPPTAPQYDKKCEKFAQDLGISQGLVGKQRKKQRKPSTIQEFQGLSFLFAILYNLFILIVSRRAFQKFPTDGIQARHPTVRRGRIKGRLRSNGNSLQLLTVVLRSEFYTR